MDACDGAVHTALLQGPTVLLFQFHFLLQSSLIRANHSRLYLCSKNQLWHLPEEGPSLFYLPPPPTRARRGAARWGGSPTFACWGGRWLHPLYGPCMLRSGFCSWRCLSSFSFPSFSGVKPENKANLQWSGLTCTVCPISTSPSGLSVARLFLSCVSCALHICLWCPQHWLSQEWSASSLSLGLSVSVHRFIFYMKALSQAKLYFFILLTSLVHCWRTRYMRPWILTSLSLGYFKGFMVIFSPKGCLGTHQMWTT